MRSLKTIKRLVFSLALLLSYDYAVAHNNVVVIPLGGDEAKTPDRKPSTPVANPVTGRSDYTVGLLTAVDRTTQLEWQRSDSGTTMGWDFAYSYCAGLVLDGHDDWRLPNIYELLSIVDFGAVRAPAIETAVFSSAITFGLYWSSVVSAHSLNTIFTVVFNDGAIFTISRTSGAYVRCVR